MDDLVPVDDYEDEDLELSGKSEAVEKDAGNFERDFEGDNENYEDEENKKTWMNGMWLIYLGMAFLWVGIAMLVYSIVFGNAPTLFSVASFLYPLGLIVFAVGAFAEAPKFAGGLKIAVFIGAAVALIFGIYSILMPLESLIIPWL